MSGHDMITHNFDLLKQFFILLELFVFGCTLFTHISELLINTFSVTLTKLMVSNTCLIVLYPDLTEVAPFVPLANPILPNTKNNKVKINFKLQNKRHL